MSFSSKSLGEKAEKEAALFLEKQGYKILQQNYRNKLGELDIVAMDKDELVFVEVKALSSTGSFDPMDHITPKKQKKLLQMAQSYTSNQISESNQRIDIVLVYCETQPWTIDHFKDVIQS